MMKTTGNRFDAKKYPFVADGYQYASDVVNGKIPNCKFIIGACKRYLKDLDEGKYPFDADAAEKYLRLVQKMEHVKGTWPTKHIHYDPWQNWIFSNIMGFKNPITGYRRFRTAHIEIPRGQGKSLLASQACLYFLALDNPVGNEISCVGTKSEQARIVLDSARAMAQKSDGYRNKTGVKVLAHKIVHEASNSFVRALSSDYASLDGLNDVLCVIDELHAVTTELFNVISSGMSKRSDSLLLCITTAGFDMEGIGYSQSQFAKKVALGEFEDDSFFSAIYSIDQSDKKGEVNDDIFSERTWRKANPGYGISVDPISFEAKAKKANLVPSDLANFKTKHLNVWVSEMFAYFDLGDWDACADDTLDINNFKRKPVFTAMDIGSKFDLTSKAYVFKENGITYIFEKTFVPAQRVIELNSPLYTNAVAAGHLISTPGSVMDYDSFREGILEDKKNFNIQEMAYDPWEAQQLANELTKNRIEVKKFPQTAANYTEAMKTLAADLKLGKVRHNGSPVLRWCIGNVVARVDTNENVKPNKSHEKLKIDPAVAVLMAFALSLQSTVKESIYKTRGIRAF